ncbi:MAG: U32 family peptidase [Sphingobacteriales bacterium]|nr:U32 family peptidase [Sphingobacteriales bacterium]
MKEKKNELLSPAGSFDSLQAAINAGADSIYFGVEQLNMRTRSSRSFQLSDIKTISNTCRKHHIKSYITLNTVMYEHDMQLLKMIFKEVKKNKIDAVIASDFAVFDYCSQLNIPLHISTQANVSNIESVKFYSRFADAIVLSRELTLKQVKNITSEIKRKKIKGPSGDLVKIEVFVHGALCMAISGKCYMSLHTQNASANRGACVQNCRRPYLVKDAESGEELVIDNEYIMSPKDLCTIDILDQVIDSGAAILKIEGRTKGADYVQVVTQCYREAIQSVYEGTFTKEKADLWKTALTKVYNRGFWEGYYLGRKSGEWTPHPGSAATEQKIYIGKGTRYYPKIGVAEFIIESGNLKVGDTLMVTGSQCGMVKEKIEALYVNGMPGNEAVKGDKITFPFTTKVTSNDKLYKMLETVRHA